METSYSVKLNKRTGMWFALLLFAFLVPGQNGLPVAENRSFRLVCDKIAENGQVTLECDEIGGRSSLDSGAFMEPAPSIQVANVGISGFADDDSLRDRGVGNEGIPNVPIVTNVPMGYPSGSYGNQWQRFNMYTYPSQSPGLIQQFVFLPVSPSARHPTPWGDQVLRQGPVEERIPIEVTRPAEQPVEIRIGNIPGPEGEWRQGPVGEGIRPEERPEHLDEERRQMEEQQRMEEERRRMEEQLRMDEEQRQRMEDRQRMEEQQRMDEEMRRMEEQQRMDEEQRQRMEQQQRMEEEMRQLEQQQRMGEERRRMEEQQRMDEEQMQRMDEERRRMEEQQRMDYERHRMEDEERHRMEEQRLQDEERRRFEEQQRLEPFPEGREGKQLEEHPELPQHVEITVEQRPAIPVAPIAHIPIQPVEEMRPRMEIPPEIPVFVPGQPQPLPEEVSRVGILPEVPPTLEVPPKVEVIVPISREGVLPSEIQPEFPSRVEVIVPTPEEIPLAPHFVPGMEIPPSVEVNVPTGEGIVPIEIQPPIQRFPEGLPEIQFQPAIPPEVSLEEVSRAQGIPPVVRIPPQIETISTREDVVPQEVAVQPMITPSVPPMEVTHVEVNLPTGREGGVPEMEIRPELPPEGMPGVVPYVPTMELPPTVEVSVPGAGEGYIVPEIQPSLPPVIGYGETIPLEIQPSIQPEQPAPFLVSREGKGLEIVPSVEQPEVILPPVAPIFPLVEQPRISVSVPSEIPRVPEFEPVAPVVPSMEQPRVSVSVPSEVPYVPVREALPEVPSIVSIPQVAPTVPLVEQPRISVLVPSEVPHVPVREPLPEVPSIVNIPQVAPTVPLVEQPRISVSVPSEAPYVPVREPLPEVPSIVSIPQVAPTVPLVEQPRISVSVPSEVPYVPEFEPVAPVIPLVEQPSITVAVPPELPRGPLIQPAPEFPVAPVVPLVEQPSVSVGVAELPRVPLTRPAPVPVAPVAPFVEQPSVSVGVSPEFPRVPLTRPAPGVSGIVSVPQVRPSLPGEAQITEVPKSLDVEALLESEKTRLAEQQRMEIIRGEQPRIELPIVRQTDMTSIEIPKFNPQEEQHIEVYPTGEGQSKVELTVRPTVGAVVPEISIQTGTLPTPTTVNVPIVLPEGQRLQIFEQGGIHPEQPSVVAAVPEFERGGRIVQPAAVASTFGTYGVDKRYPFLASAVSAAAPSVIPVIPAGMSQLADLELMVPLTGDRFIDGGEFPADLQTFHSLGRIGPNTGPELDVMGYSYPYKFKDFRAYYFHPTSSIANVFPTSPINE